MVDTPIPLSNINVPEAIPNVTKYHTDYVTESANVVRRSMEKQWSDVVKATIELTRNSIERRMAQLRTRRRGNTAFPRNRVRSKVAVSVFSDPEGTVGQYERWRFSQLGQAVRRTFGSRRYKLLLVTVPTNGREVTTFCFMAFDLHVLFFQLV